ncbi:hypothetical protein IEE_05367 [Bacillus cereus BAG5X1-1]|uniref:Uncharacterized protein n=1 Tax=Bacillus cereus BAG5X1-1 TaxID=1053189 RepID=J8AAE2_BACCE|nr:hypothetical protein [Bacillus cereus]EJQ36470.1 hypothetical protein IEE_05367 [Bacillus cereus BAG5X1-1]
MKRQKIKKIAKVMPAAFVLSTALFVAPGFSSAESAPSKSPKSERVMLVDGTGQKLASTQQTANFESLIPLPQGPNDLFPAKTSSFKKDGDIVDYIYVDYYATEDNYSNNYSINPEDSSIFILPDNTVMSSSKEQVITLDNGKITEVKGTAFNGSGSTLEVKNAKKGQYLYTLGYSKKQIEKMNTYGYNLGAKVKSEYHWDLISQDLVGKHQGMSLAHTVTHGMSHQVQVGLSYTLGMEVGLEGIAKVNQSITASFGYTLGLSEERTETRTFIYNPIPDYPYPYYRGAIYQGKVKYSVEPNEDLKQYLTSQRGIMYSGTEGKFKGEQELPVNMFAIVNSQ